MATKNIGENPENQINPAAKDNGQDRGFGINSFVSMRRIDILVGMGWAFTLGVALGVVLFKFIER